MSFIDIPTDKLNDVQEPAAVPEGEYSLSILSAEVTEARSGGNMISLVFRINDEVAAKTLRDWLHIPKEDDEPAAENRKLLRIKQFCEAFDYDIEGGIDTDALVGLEGKALLALREDETYGEQNSVRKYLA